MGWKLDIGAIERETRFGVNYSGDDYSLRLSGNTGDLGEHRQWRNRAKLESGFNRVRELSPLMV